MKAPLSDVSLGSLFIHKDEILVKGNTRAGGYYECRKIGHLEKSGGKSYVVIANKMTMRVVNEYAEVEFAHIAW